MLIKLSDLNIDSISVSKIKDAKGNGSTFNYYIQSDNKPIEIQTDWITLDNFPLNGKKFITDDTKSINLQIMFEEKDDPTYEIFNKLDDYLQTNPPIPNKSYFNMVWEKDNFYCIKFKLYLNTEVFDINKEKIEIKSFHDFYHFLKRGNKIRFVFGFSKLWTMGKDFGFAPAVRRIQLFGDKDDKPPEKIKFVDDD